MKETLWKYLGAMMSEMKDGKMAASFTRILGVCTFAAWLPLTIMEAFHYGATLNETGVLAGGVEVPSVLTWGMMSLIGIKGAKDVVKGITGESSYSE